MPSINLLPPKTPIIKSHWIIYTLCFLLFSAVCFYYFKQPWQKLTPTPTTEKASKVSKTGLLNNYFLHQLKMVGFLKAEDTQSMALGLLKSPEQKVVTVKIGDCIGKEKAWITSIEGKKIVLQLPEKAAVHCIYLAH